MKKYTKIYIAIVVIALAAVIGGFLAVGAGESVTPQAIAATGKKAVSSTQAWFVRCNDGEDVDKKSPKRERCEVFQRLNVAENGKRLVEFAIGHPKDKESAEGVFILPLGILLQPGVTMQIGDNPPLTFSARYCDTNGCFAFVTLSDDVLQMLKSADKAILKFRASNGKELSIEMPLTGFKKAWKEIF